MGPRRPFLLLAVAAAAILATSGCAKASRGSGAGGPSRRVGVALELSGTVRRPLSELAFSELERQVAQRGGRLVDGREGETASGRVPGLDARCLYTKLAGRDGAQILRSLAEEGRDLVVAVGPSFSSSLSEVARDFPRVRFAIIGAGLGGMPAAPNASSYSFDGAQGSFLLGALAGYMVSGEDRPGVAKPKLGFIGGADTPAVHACQAGFQAGAAYAAPALRRPGSLLALYCGRYAAAFDDPEVARAIALSQLKKGARVLFLAAGASGRGAAQAAFEAGALAMDYSEDTLSEETLSEDKATGSVSAAIAPRSDVAMASLIGELFASGTVSAGAKALSAKDGALDVAVAGAKREVLAAYLPLVEQARERIASGEIEVPGDDASAAEFISALK